MNEPCDIRVRLLQLLVSGPASLRSLTVHFPKWQVYRIAKELRAEGLVVPGSRTGTWQLTASGVSAAEHPGEPQSPPVTWPTLPGVPHLELLPSREHEALGRLILLAATARKAYDHHHASFVLYSSSGLKGKTFTARWAALVLGGGEVLHAVAEGGRSLGARRRGDGQIAAVRSALAGTLLMIDEWRRGSADVRRITTMLISGDRSIPLEDEAIIVNAVILLAMNSPRDATSVESATGLDAAMIRRCIAADLEHITLDPTFARDGEERLDRARAMGPVTLPDIRPVDERALRDRIADALEAVLDSTERMGSLDLVLLGQLAVAACAWGLSAEDAVAMVVHDACVAWNTTGWTQVAWERSLAEVLGRETEERLEPTMAPVVAEEQDLGEYDYEARVAELDRVARAHGAGEPQVLEQRLALATAVDRAGLDHAHLPGLVELLRIVRGPDRRPTDRLRVLSALDDLHVDPREALGVLALVPGGRELGLDAVDLLLVLRGIEEAGLDLRAVGPWLVEILREHGRIDGEIMNAQAELREWRLKVREAAEDLATVNARIKKLSKVLERASREPTLARSLRLADSEVGRDVLEAATKAAGEIAG